MLKTRILLLLIIAIASVNSYKPIIAIFANSSPENEYKEHRKSYLSGTNVRWLQESGAEVMVIQPWYTIEQVDAIIPKINGVLFQGGSRTFVPTAHWETLANHIIEKSIALFSTNEIFPILGICQGFQLIHQLMSKAEKEEDILERYDNNKVLSKLVVTDKSDTARLFSFLKKANQMPLLFDHMTTHYFHTYGVSLATFNKFSLSDKLDITSMGNDKQQKEFVNSVEGKNGVPIYATQFHPEVVPYGRTDSYDSHSIESIKVSRMIGMFIVSEARKSTHRMKDEEKKDYDFINSYSKGNYAVFDNEYRFERKTTE